MSSLPDADFDDIDGVKYQIEFDTTQNYMIVSDLNTKEMRREELTSARLMRNSSRTFSRRNSEITPSSSSSLLGPMRNFNKAKTAMPPKYDLINQDETTAMNSQLDDTMRSAGPFDETMRSNGELDETMRSCGAEDSFAFEQKRLLK